MATKRQIAANRRNAKKSTGPKSASGKKQSSQNALRHGLSLSRAFEKQASALAAQIARNTDGSSNLALARRAAEADLQLQQARQLKRTMIERIMLRGNLDGPIYFRSKKEEREWFKANYAWIRNRGPMPPFPHVINSVETMPQEEPNRTAEAVLRVLPEFVRLLRYENRAAGRRDLAIRKMKRKTVPGAAPV
jgi:hypothetical protein